MSQTFKCNFLYLLLLPFIHFWLLELFVSASYIFYFLSLFSLTFFLYKSENYLDNAKLFYYVVYWIFIYLLALYLKDNLYDIYIDYDLSFTIGYMPLSVAIILSALHIFILFLLGYNKRR